MNLKTTQMKKAKQFLFVALAAIIALSSCTMEKRAYRQGYHISWNNNSNHHLTAKNNVKKHNDKGEAQIDEQSETAKTIDDRYIEDDNQIASLDNKQIILPKKQPIHIDAKSLIGNSKELQTTIPYVFKSNKSFEKSAIASEEKKVEPLGLIGFIASLLALVLCLTTTLIELIFVLSILGIVFGAISLGKIRRHSDKYKGRGFAFVSLFGGIVGVIIGIAYVVVLAASSVGLI